jgi:UDP-N-acetylglucosamine 1-carboxyvinyltransferase
MDALRITGGIPLRGTVAVSGAKNAALPILAACLLADGPVVLAGVPRVADVRRLVTLLRRLGMDISREPDESLRIETRNDGPYRVDRAITRRLRASICVLGPLLARRRRAVIAHPGGCRIGGRPVNLHLAGLAALGAELHAVRGCVWATARNLRAATIHLAGEHGPTVTGTANVICAAVLAPGVTTIHGAAMEPEVVDLGNFLKSMGAQIDGLGTGTLHVRGVHQLSGTHYRIIPDRIEAATLLGAGAVTGGRITVTGLAAEHLGAVLAILRAIGVKLEVGAGQITVDAPDQLRAWDVTARPYPGLPTDVQPLLTALLTVARGTSSIQDHVFPERFTHLNALARMGAHVRRSDRGALVHGVRRLVGNVVHALDLRGAAALVLAGLAAQGETAVKNVHYLDRGYEHLDEKLGKLGACIERISISLISA